MSTAKAAFPYLNEILPFKAIPLAVTILLISKASNTQNAKGVFECPVLHGFPISHLKKSHESNKDHLGHIGESQKLTVNIYDY